MIKRLAVTNFKCFVKQDFELGRLNVLAGANGGGKSTVVQALLLLLQSEGSGALARSRLQLNGPLVDLGTGQDVLYRRSESDEFDVSLTKGDRKVTVTAKVSSADSQHVLGATVEGSAADLRSELSYVSADRLGPQTSYPMNVSGTSGNEIGRRGEFAPLVFARRRAEPTGNTHLLLETSEKRSFADVETQFTLWMQRLFPGFSLRADNLEQLDAIRLGLNLQQEHGKSTFLRPSNVGFGVSVAFPIVLCGVLAGDDSLLIVENPEAHLHPSAQSVMGEFLARVSAGGTQVIVETHSDHVVNGLRIAFKSGLNRGPGELKFFAFVRTRDYGSHHVFPLSLGQDGDFVERPESFFDQADRDLKLIYGL